LGALWPFSFNAFLGRALAGFLPALERFFIVSARTLTKGIVAGQDSNGHGRARPIGDHLNHAMPHAVPRRAAHAIRSRGRASLQLRAIEGGPDLERF
jgi:hypothetical protein